MKLFRYGDKGSERPGLVDAAGSLRDLSGAIDDLAGDRLTPAGLDRLRAIDANDLPLLDGKPRLGPCVGGVGKVIGIGLNYADHAAEAGLEPPSEPILFMKATSALAGPNDPIEIPRGSEATDWEIELGVVIGSRARYVSENEALAYVAGYCTLNDVSERDDQIRRQGQWTKGKCHDSFAPIGPWLVTADQVPDPQKLRLWCEVDGVMRQNGTTATMIFNVAHLVAYCSQFMTLEPGDIIATGTPPGVGMGIKPAPVYLKPGQRLRCAVEGLGEQDHVTVAAQP